MTEADSDRDTRHRRLRIRCWRRGTKEMDLILGSFSDQRLPELSDEELSAFEALLDENDNDLYLWVSGALAAPDRHEPILARVRAHHGLGDG